jgi:splicing factor 3A subunit 2
VRPSTQDPYILRNHLGGLECRLCLTIHTNEGSYLAHTQGKKHQTNLARRAARDAHDPNHYAAQMAAQQAQKAQVQTKTFIKIGMPGYQVRTFSPVPCRMSRLMEGMFGA